MKHLEVQGAPTVMGEAHGEAFRDQIAALYAARIDNAIGQAKSYGGVSIDEAGLLAIAKRCLPIVEGFAPAGYLELTGIARGAKMSLESIWAMNALTDLRDVAAWGDPRTWGGAPEGEGCSAFVVAPDRAKDGAALVGQTWDLSTDNLPFVILLTRKPESGPSTRTLTTVGCLSLIGMNEAGIAIGTTNIRTLDARAGVGYLDVIHAVLAETSLKSAVARVVDAPRAGAHYFYVMDASGSAAAIECTAAQSHVQHITSGTFVHCNHVLAEKNVELEVKGTPVVSSHHRQARFSELLTKNTPLDEVDLFRFLADHADEPNSICRHDYNGITSNAGVVMSPTDGRFWAVHGPPCEGTWQPFA